MYRILYRFLASLARLAVRSGCSKDLEIIVSRHQLAVLRRQVDRPEFTDADRSLLGAIAAALPRSSRACGCGNPVVADQAACRYSLTSPSHRVDLRLRGACVAGSEGRPGPGVAGHHGWSAHTAVFSGTHTLSAATKTATLASVGAMVPTVPTGGRKRFGVLGELNRQVAVTGAVTRLCSSALTYQFVAIYWVSQNRSTRARRSIGVVSRST